MKRLNRFTLFVATFFCSVCFAVQKESVPDYTQYVDAFIGTADNGHTFPGACVPFGMIQAGPETGLGAWRYCAGYNYEDDFIEGFSQTRLNGTGMGDLGDVFMYPFCGDMPDGYKSRYDKTTHRATAGYYSVSLTDAGVDVRITATERTAFHHYTFNRKDAKIFLDLQRGIIRRIETLGTRVLDADIKIVDDRTITGAHHVRGWVERRFFYVVKFDKPFTAQELPLKKGEKAKRLLLSFGDAGQVQVKVALSSVGVDGAMASLEKECPGWDFDRVREQARSAWNSLLSRIEMTGSEDQKVSFYTSMYHLFIQPNNIADLDGRYRGADDKVCRAPSGNYYSTLSLWDTYRAAHPLYTIVTPEIVDGVVQTMIDHQKAQGWLPIWALWGKENYCMIANHAVPVIVDAYLKGFRGFDPKQAYAAIRASLLTSHEKSDWETYDKYGYYPFDIVKQESVSRTLESGYDDYCASVMAKALGEKDDFNYFRRRAGFYKNLFDPQYKLMRGRDSKGNWRTPFDRFHLSHAGSSGGDYTEGNAWQYTWHVQHDIPSLVGMMGGKKQFAAKLDSLFYLDVKVEQGGFTGDVTGLVGQYAHGNEPSHHVIYLYNYADRRDKTAELVREVFDRFYMPRPDGLCGNDDCGQMSAWYVFSAMGFYPVNPCGGEYVLGAPQIPFAVLHLEGGKTFTVIAHNLSTRNKYVRSVKLNGKTLDGFVLRHSDIMKGGRLEFFMASE